MATLISQLTFGFDFSPESAPQSTRLTGYTIGLIYLRKTMTYASFLLPDKTVFNKPCSALEDTDWVSDPANPLESSTGPLYKGDRIWLQQAHFGSGPAWQPARLANGTLCYVNPAHFDAPGN